MSETFVPVAPLKEVPEGEARVFHVNGQSLLLCQVDGSVYAIEDICTHDDGPLGDGTLEGFAIECPRHGAKFDVRDGSVLSMPAAYPVRSFPTRVEDGQVHVDLSKD